MIGTRLWLYLDEVSGQWHQGTVKSSLLSVLLPAGLAGGLIFLAGIAVADSALPLSGEFSGQWSVTGEERSMEFLDNREVSILRHRGEVNLTTRNGLPRAFFSTCLGFSDSAEVGKARCAWEDSRGDRLYIEITSRFLGAKGQVEGKIVGGTGRYAGIHGLMRMDAWLYSSSNKEERDITAFTDSLSGSWTFE